MRLAHVQTALVIAFPLYRRRALVKKLTTQMLDRSPIEAEKHLAFELARHQRLLTRWQISRTAISAQLRSLEGSVRRELWRRVMAGPGGSRTPSDGQRGGDA